MRGVWPEDVACEDRVRCKNGLCGLCEDVGRDENRLREDAARAEVGLRKNVVRADEAYEDTVTEDSVSESEDGTEIGLTWCNGGRVGDALPLTGVEKGLPSGTT